MEHRPAIGAQPAPCVKYAAKLAGYGPAYSMGSGELPFKRGGDHEGIL